MMLSFLAVTIWAVFPPGTADNPSAMAPIEPSGEVQAFWWDEDAFHVGERTFAWRDIGGKPAEGSLFTVNLGESVLRDKIELKGMLKGNAPRYRVGCFGQIGNTNVRTCVEMVATAKGKVKSYLWAGGATQDYMQVPMSRNVEVGDKATFDISTPRCSSSGLMDYSLTDVDGKKLYSINGRYRDPKIAFDWQYVYTDPSDSNLVVNTYGWNDDEGCKVRISARDYTSDTLEAWSKTCPVGKLWGKRDLRFELDGLSPGFYHMHLEYYGGNGAKIGEDRRFPYLVPSAKMPWEGNTLGMEDTVPPPWTKPEFTEDGTFRCWNREVKLGGDGLVQSVKCGGKELLMRPVSFVMDGKPLAFDARLCSRKNSEASYVLKARDADVAVRVKCEFDGFICFEAEYPTTVRSLVWKVAAKRAFVTGFDDCSKEDNPNAFFPKGKNPSFDFNPGDQQMWWMPGKIGIMGGIPSMHGWHARNIDKAGRVSTTDDEIEVSTTFVDEPMPAGPRRTVSFYLEPTPVKPKNLKFAATDETKWTLWTGHVMKYFEVKYPGFENPLACKPFKDEIKKGVRVFFYNGSSGYAYGDAFWNRYRYPWHRNGYKTFAHEAPSYELSDRDTGWTYGCLASKDFFEFKLWGVNWYLHEPVPEMKDLYFDLANPGRCQNEAHGCVWKDDFGRRVEDRIIMPVREFHKRVYRLLKAKNSDGAMYGHVGSRMSPSGIFFDMICMGEGYAYKVHQNNYTYYDIFTPEVMQSFFVPRVQEMVTLTSPQFARSRSCWAPHLVSKYSPFDPETERAIRHYIAYVKIHDLLIERKPDHPEGPQFYKVDSPIRRIREKGVYSAYYHEGEPSVAVSNPGPRFLWAWFADAKEAVLVLLNDTDSDVEEIVKVKGLASKGKEILNGTQFDFTSGECKINFGPRAAKFISFKFNDK